MSHPGKPQLLPPFQVKWPQILGSQLENDALVTTSELCKALHLIRSISPKRKSLKLIKDDDEDVKPKPLRYVTYGFRSVLKGLSRKELCAAIFDSSHVSGRASSYHIGFAVANCPCPVAVVKDLSRKMAAEVNLKHLSAVGFLKQLIDTTCVMEVDETTREKFRCVFAKCFQSVEIVPTPSVVLSDTVKLPSSAEQKNYPDIQTDANSGQMPELGAYIPATSIKQPPKKIKKKC